MSGKYFICLFALFLLVNCHKREKTSNSSGIRISENARLNQRFWQSKCSVFETADTSSFEKFSSILGATISINDSIILNNIKMKGFLMRQDSIPTLGEFRGGTKSSVFTCFFLVDSNCSQKDGFCFELAKSNSGTLVEFYSNSMFRQGDIVIDIFKEPSPVPFSRAGNIRERVSVKISSNYNFQFELDSLEE